MPFKKVTPSIQSLDLGTVNCFLLRSTSGYALVDTVKDLLPVPPVKVDRCVVDGETLHELDGLRVIHTPGHSAG